MPIGLLLCDHVRPGFRVIAGDYPDYFTRLLPGRPIVTYDLTAGQFPTDLDECEAWITTGSRHFVSDDIGWIGDFAALVRRIHREERALVGICFGTQMIAHALGGEVWRAPTGWAVGIREVEVVESEGWMSPRADRFRILHGNADQVKTLPPGARLLGRSEDVPISVFALDDHIVAFQGHPEFTPAYSAVLMESRRATIIPEDVVDAGLASLTEPDTALLAGWIENFIDGRE
jgi:GMP synthase-like glutamine amidotransferase